MNTLIVEFLMGHDIGLAESYFKPTEQAMLEEYVKAVDQLTINNDTMKVQKKIAELQKRSSDNEYILKLSCKRKMNS